VKRILFAIVTVAVVWSVGASAQSGYQLFQQALSKEQAEGKLNDAIVIYQRIVKDFAGDHALAAKALLRLGEAYQKLGDKQAQQAFERIVRDYADQKEAVVIARARLSGEAHRDAGGMTSRRLWTTEDAWDFLTGATISPDGRFVSYTDWQTGNLGLHEFATGADRRLTNNGTSAQYVSWAEESAISRDGKHVAYSWFNGKNRYELRVASLEGAGVPQSRVLFDNEDVEFLMPCDWSPDGSWIAVELARADKTRQMGLISVRDGSLHALKSSEWSGSIELFFSPDGKYLGFDAPVGDTNKGPRDVFIMAVDGSRQVAAATGSSHDTMMGWSPDGKYLLFASDRGGTVGLWAVPVADGRPQGKPELMKSDISRFSLGVSASGSLYMGVPIGDRDIQVASVDFETGKLVSGPVRPVQSFVGSNTGPAWSPDGKYLAYISNRPPPVYNSFLGIQSVETGQVRELQPKLTYFQNVRWTPDGRSFIVGGKDLKDRQGQYRIDVQTADVTPIAMRGQPSPDGKRIYYPKNLGTDGVSLVEQDLSTGHEREIIQIRQKVRLGTLSPDGNFLPVAYDDASTKSSAVLLIPITGGEPRELLRVRQPQSFGPAPVVEWMPDGRAVLVTKVVNDSQDELWLVPVGGREPRKIDIGAPKFQGPIKVHPDGRRVAYVAGDRKADVWVLENFLAALIAKK
jgi:Tol biopolymer transport system component